MSLLEESNNRQLYPKLANIALVSDSEICCGKMELSHDNLALMHPVLQVNTLSRSVINFHSTTPAAVHAFSVDMAIELFKTSSPGATKPGRYLPTPHSWHVLNPAVAVYFPAGQARQTDAFAPEYVPAAQFKHALLPSLEYVPAQSTCRRGTWRRRTRLPRSTRRRRTPSTPMRLMRPRSPGTCPRRSLGRLWLPTAPAGG